MQLVEEGLQLQREQVQTQEALIAKGIAIADPTALERKRLELEDNRIQLTAAERQLASGLLRLTCCHTNLARCHTESLEIQPQAFDCDCLVSYALQHRHDYLAIVHLCNCLDEDTALMVARLLAPLIGAGMDMVDLSLLERLYVKHRGEELLVQIRRELKLASDVLRARIEQSVCDKCQALQAAYERVAIAQAVIGTWETRLAASGDWKNWETREERPWPQPEPNCCRPSRHWCRGNCPPSWPKWTWPKQWASYRNDAAKANHG